MYLLSYKEKLCNDRIKNKKDNFVVKSEGIFTDVGHLAGAFCSETVFNLCLKALSETDTKFGN